MRKTLIVALIGIFVLGACAPAQEPDSNTALMPSPTVPEGIPVTLAPTPEPTPTAVPANPLGILSLEENRVLHGHDENVLVPLLESASFYEHDIVQVIEGGEAVLDFGDLMQLRLFNDTSLEMVSAEIAEGVPLGVQVFLFVGGFTGQLTEEGGRAVFLTPGGVEITVLGTEYFIVYNPQTETTTVGNFSGNVEVASAGSQLSLEDRSFVIVPAGIPPGPVLPLPMSRAEFEIQAREASSPVQAADEANEWSLEIRHEFTLDVEGSISTHLRLWTGQFTLEGDTIVGSGVGVIDNVNITCPNIDRNKFDIEGSFSFSINGQLVTGEDSHPAFMFEIVPDNLEMTKSLDLASCNGFIDAVVGLNRTIVEDLPLLGEDAIVVRAAEGAMAIFELDGAPYNNENSIYFRTPIEVTVRSGK
jgi:hypothetical protein